MEFWIGLIVGLLLSILVIMTLIYFKVKVERFIDRTETKIENAGPKLKGSIYVPKDDASIAREEIIKKNKEAGKDTPFSELN